MASTASTFTASHVAAQSSVRAIAARAALWAYTLISGIVLGASIYEYLVITPLWLRSLPESVINWNLATRYPIVPGKFWEPIEPFFLVVSLICLALAWFGPRGQRRWLGIAGGCAVAGLLTIALFFVPILQKTVLTNGNGLPEAEITRLSLIWAHWQWLCLVMIFAGWIAAVRGLTVSNPQSE